MKIVLDTSVIIGGRITSLIDAGKYRGALIIIPEAVIAEIESQANRHRESGYNGLEELKKLREMANLDLVELEFAGKRPGRAQLELAGTGEIDAMIRQVAIDCDAALMTGDLVQSRIAEARGLEVIFLPPEKTGGSAAAIEEFFTPDTMSVHLKDGVQPLAKKGSVRDIQLVRIDETIITEDELRSMARELIERTNREPDSFIELQHDGATVLQLGNMRIAIASPPFSDGMEITAVRPVTLVSIDDYRLSEELKQRLAALQRGVLIAGPPGAGKSTFAAGVAEFLQSCNKIVKTMESPRDLSVEDTITQYSPLEGSMEKTADLLLLVRPDYTVYDELRKTTDFQVFADMRLAGVGMVGVVHANRPVDAIQRLIGRVDLGMIPQVVDTVIFIDKGEVASVQDIRFTVKVPQGMTESDLARPVITVTDFESGRTEFEIYTYGEQVVVMPVAGAGENISPAWQLAAERIREEFRSSVHGPVRVELSGDNRATLWVSDIYIPEVIGRGGRNIEMIEKRLGIKINVKALESGRFSNQAELDKTVVPEISMKKKHIVLTSPGLAGADVEVVVNGALIFTATVGLKGDIRILKDSEIGDRLQKALRKNQKIRVRPVNRNL